MKAYTDLEQSKKLAETLGGIISYCASSLIFAILIYFTYKLKSTGIINMDIMMLLFIINVIIYVVLIFASMNLSFKITDKINKKYDNTKKAKSYDEAVKVINNIKTYHPNSKNFVKL